MDVIEQDADGDSLERSSLFHLGVGAPQTFDVTDQQVAATVGERKQASVGQRRQRIRAKRGPDDKFRAVPTLANNDEGAATVPDCNLRFWKKPA
jgi:hypothetical protein